MNREEFKLTLLKIAKEKPSLISHLALEKNVGATERRAVYARDSVYMHSSFNLLIQISRRFVPDNVPEFNIQFHDGLTPPPNWSQTILGEFGIYNVLRQVFWEQIEFDGSAIHFVLMIASTDAHNFDFIFSHSAERLYESYYYLNTGVFKLNHLDAIRKMGRGKSRSLPAYYIDCVFGESEYRKLLNDLNQWGIKNHFSESEMKQIKVFCDYCMNIKGTKQKSKMVRIIEYLRDNPLPHRDEFKL